MKQLHDYRILWLTCTYLDVLEKITPMSSVFEGNRLLAYKVQNAIDLTIFKLQDLCEPAAVLVDWWKWWREVSFLWLCKANYNLLKPENWENEATEFQDSEYHLAKHLLIRLLSSANGNDVLWKSHYVGALAKHRVSCVDIWKKVFQYYCLEFSILYLLVEIRMVQFGSDSNTKELLVLLQIWWVTINWSWNMQTLKC